ncbi:MAG: MXAN_6640 family putative metalloprotease [Polyangiales bacterium]
MGLPRLLSCALAAGALLSCGAPDPFAQGAQEIRPDQPGIGPPAFDATERVERFDSPGGTFRIHYTRAGRNAVPAVDANGNMVPDYVEETAGMYDRVLAFYRDMRGFRAPPDDLAVRGGNGGDARFDVYLVDFAGRADGAFRREECDPAASVTCPGYMLQENDFVGYPYASTLAGTTVLSSHEFFHAVQAGYDARRGPVLEEATAVWATEQFDPTLRDFEGFVPGYLSRPDRSLDQVLSGPVDAFTYGAAIFFQFLTERHDARVVQRLWAACGMDDGSTGWLDVLDGVLRRDYASSFAAEYAEFVVWNLYTGARANPRRAYANGASYPLVTTTRAALPFSDNQVRLFYAATRYYTAVPGDRGALAVALVPMPDAPADALDGVQVRVAVRRGNVVDEPRRLTDLTGGTETVDVTGATELIVALTNVRTVGPSRTPGVCIGTAAEVAACREMLAPGSTDAGTADAAPDVDVPAADVPVADAGADASVAPAPAGGCGCSTPGPARVRGVGALACLAALAMRRRVRRR